MIPIALLSWIPVSAFFFTLMRPVRAAVVAYVVGWLILPAAAIQVEGFWDIDKTVVCNIGVVLGIFLFRPGLISGLRWTGADMLLLAFAASTCVTSILNELGHYDGLASCAEKIMWYGVPFWVGRFLIRSREDLWEALNVVVLGAGLHALPALWEWRMSPQIHYVLYGMFQHSFLQHERWGFYRPILCFPHALSLAMFFAWTSVLSVALHQSRLLRPVWGIPVGVVAALPVIGLMASMSIGPWGLFAAGIALLILWRKTRWRWIIVTPALFALCWMVGRYGGGFDGQLLTQSAAQLSEERAASLQYRIDAESALVSHAKERPFFGWGGWGRNQVLKESGRVAFRNDGLWIIFLGCYGIVGLSLFHLWWCWPLVQWIHSRAANQHDSVIAAVLAAVGMQLVNGLFNGVMIPTLTVLCGGIVTQLQPRLRRSSAAASIWNAHPRRAPVGARSVENLK